MMAFEPVLLFVGAVAGGVGLGIVTGLIPGLHVNTLAPSLVVLGLAVGEPVAAAGAILSMATTHTVLNVVPTLAAPLPDEETALLLLPIQELARAGRATEALCVSVRASWSGGLWAAGALLALLWLAPDMPRLPAHWTVWGVTSIVALLMLRHERGPLVAVTFVLAGFVGFVLLDVSMVGPFGGEGSALLPIFTGFFGFPMLWLTLREHATCDAAAAHLGGVHGEGAEGDASAAQGRSGAGAVADGVPYVDSPGSARDRSRERRGLHLATAVGTFCGLLVSLFPGLTSATAATFGRSLRPSGSEVEEVAMVSAVDTANAVGNVGALLLWEAYRSGATIAVGRVAGVSTLTGDAWVAASFVAALLASLGAACSVSLRWGPGLVTVLRRVDPRRAAWGTLGLLAAIVSVVNGLGGLLVACLLVPLGLLPLRWGVPRAALMGVLLVPYLYGVHTAG